MVRMNTATKDARCDVLQGDALSEYLLRIDRLLTSTEWLWLAPEFSSRGIEARYQEVFKVPGLAQALTDTSLQQLEQLDADPQQLFARLRVPLSQVAADFSPLYERLQHFLVPSFALAAELPSTLPFWLESGIGGRKLTQVKHFIAHAPAMQGDVLEWCAGKGHLGRLWLYHTTQSAVQPQSSQTTASQVHSLEWQQALCEQGEQLARQHQIPQRFYPINALGPIDWQALHRPQHAMALHACGDLHRALINHGVANGAHTLCIAPCCYHVTQDAMYRPFSAQLRSTTALKLSKSSLKLAVQGQVTGGQRIQTLRQQEVLWRLAYQCLWEAHHEQAYQPLPNFPKAMLSADFCTFVDWACVQHQWQLDQPLTPDTWLEQATVLQLKLKRIDLVRHSFRRLLEMWLVLDRAVFLQEQQYRVEVEVFCPYAVSPRNLMIRAQR